jgi:hypothetical protein
MLQYRAVLPFLATDRGCATVASSGWPNFLLACGGPLPVESNMASTSALQPEASASGDDARGAASATAASAAAGAAAGADDAAAYLRDSGALDLLQRFVARLLLERPADAGRALAQWAAAEEVGPSAGPSSSGGGSGGGTPTAEMLPDPAAPDLPAATCDGDGDDGPAATTPALPQPTNVAASDVVAAILRTATLAASNTPGGSPGTGNGSSRGGGDRNLASTQTPSPATDAAAVGLVLEEAVRVLADGTKVEADTDAAEQLTPAQLAALLELGLPKGVRLYSALGAGIESGVQSFSLAVNHAAFNGWVKQPSACCAASALTGAWNASIGMPRPQECVELAVFQ